MIKLQFGNGFVPPEDRLSTSEVTLAHSNRQKTSFNEIWTRRGAAALTTWPKVALPMLPSTEAGP
jgi:hypothetical protein